MLARRVAVPQLTSNATRRVVGQWGGAGGACCEDHFLVGGEAWELSAACSVLLVILVAYQNASCEKILAEARTTGLNPDWRPEDSREQRYSCVGSSRSVRTAFASCARGVAEAGGKLAPLLFPLIRTRRGATKTRRTVRDSRAKRASSARRAATTETVVRNAPAARGAQQRPRP